MTSPPTVVLARLLGWMSRAFFDAEPAADQHPSVELRAPESPDPNGGDAAR